MRKKLAAIKNFYCGQKMQFPRTAEMVRELSSHLKKECRKSAVLEYWEAGVKKSCKKYI